MSIVFALEDLDDETKIDIRKSLTFEGEISYIASQFNSDPKQIKFFNVKDGNVYLPHFTGLSLKEDVDFGNYPEKTEFSTTTPLRSLQEEVIEEAIPVLMETKSISIIMPTGTGKTRTATEIISRLPGKAVILYSLLSLGASWMGNFQKHTDCKSVCLLDKRTTLDNWVEKYNDFPDILLVPCERVNWLSSEIRGMYRILVIDEAHLFCTPEYSKTILPWQVEFVIALTATTGRSDGLFDMMSALTSHIIEKKVDRPFKVIKVETGIIPEIEKNRKTGFADWAKLSKFMAENNERNNIICDLLSYIQTEEEEESIDTTPDRMEVTIDGVPIKNKILTLMARTAQLEGLQELLGEREMPHSSFYGKARSYNDAPIILGTYKKMSTGFDEELACPDFCGIKFNRLINGSSLKDHLTLEQSVGRVFRINYPIVYDLVDEHKIFERHWDSRRKWYTSKGAEIEDLTVS